MASLRRLSALLAALGTFSQIPTTYAADTVYISGTGLDGVTRQLAVDRAPALYTGDFGDCLGGESLMNITKFDAGFYYDNSTVLFHLEGATNLQNDSLMLYISVEAYGQNRFSMTVDPCFMNVDSLCPLNASIPITAYALFHIGEQQVSGIPQIAFEIPDFEGFARIQIFSNASQTEIGCFQAVMRNGNTFSQPAAIGPVLGVFTIAAIVASFATAAYGVSIPHMRTHYAHSLSVLAIFETYQSIFFSGALSVNWPSVLPAWWSNFAWSAGLIPALSIVHSVDSFAGVSGNASQVGGAGSTIINNQGGLLQQIYGRSLSTDVPDIYGRSVATDMPNSETKGALDLARRSVILAKRQPYNANNPYDYNWNGDPVTPGMPIPGDWSGFAGDLSELGIPAPDAFTIALIWLLIVLALVAFLVVSFKFVLEGLVKLKWINQDRLQFFRSHWRGYTCMVLLRTLFIAFFSMMVLAMFQISHHGRAGPTALAAIIFVFFMLGVGGLAIYALNFRLRFGKFASEPDRILVQRKTVWKFLPWLVPVRHSQLKEKESVQKPIFSLPFVHWHFMDNDKDRTKVHQDEPYLKRFGWLSARYRLSRWWYFIVWLGYQLIRACFIGGATSSPLAQIYGLFVVDVLSLIIIAAFRPYEGQRNTALAVWLLGLTKIATTGLSIAFLPRFGIDRILATVIGVVIIVMQALLTIAVLILIILGSISSWMSLTRNREYFPSQRLEGVRIKYFEHLERRALDKEAPKKEKPTAKLNPPEPEDKLPDLPKEPYFSVNSVRRISKIEDEDDDFIAEMEPVNASGPSTTPHPLNRTRRVDSVSSRHSVSSLPRGARVHRVSWSSRDFNSWQTTELDRPGTTLAKRLSGHAPSLSETNITGVLKNQASESSFRAYGTVVAGSRPMSPTLEQEERVINKEISS
ncbi:uncharacterized protein BCR38DRAFT_487697 [Pseudomassariella vexata]|uniref:ML-like domain-containing protein n=1 Tax=Pseudomassariella vexata TaxID=1141098 RepID=A0A1Y2DMZ1_9PEZI|nr:uncharacterized protein BCR38DRAFT_487697 [Pseudomassariella vexata]ORY60642.1 hypothetical protein BCR38DRAFT_487697 [Pseudomassariella vexata]